MTFRLSVFEVLISTFLTCACSDDCPDGKMPGACGLVGECVECITDDDCAFGPGNTCTSDGKCIEAARCLEDSQCGIGYICFDGRCYLPCNSDEDCVVTKRCAYEGYCYSERCTEEGRCPDGWEPVKGSLICIYSGE